MFNFKKRTITLYVNSEYIIDIEHFIKDHVKVYGVVNNYIDGDKALITLTTNLTMKDMCNLIEKTLYKTEARINGTIIMVNFKSY